MPNNSHQTISPHTHIARQLCNMARKSTRLRMNTGEKRWNTRIGLTNAQRKLSGNQRTPPFEISRPRYYGDGVYASPFYRSARETTGFLC